MSLDWYFKTEARKRLYKQILDSKIYALVRAKVRLSIEIERLMGKSEGVFTRGLEGRVSKEDIERACDAYIPDFIEFNKNWKARCISGEHPDNKPSMTYNRKYNTVKCFSCGYAGNAIEAYRKVTGADFKTAVRELKCR